jgi:hypothetical protein
VRPLHRVALVALLVFIVAAGTSVIAQKGGKPAPQPTTRWTLEVRGVATSELPPNTGTILGGLGANPGLGVIYDPAKSSAVTTVVQAATTRSPWNHFRLNIKNLSVLAPNEASDETRWITFRNLAFQPEGMSFDSVWGPYSSNADKLGPYKDAVAGTWVWPFTVDGGVQPTAQPDYQAAFLNDFSHPRQFYSEVELIVTYSADSFLNLQPGVPTLIEPLTGFSVWAKRDCTEPLASGVGIYTDRPERAAAQLPHMSQPAYITRLDDSSWQLEIYQPIKLIEFGYQIVQSTQRKSTVEACTGKTRGGWWTYPVKFTLIVSRVTS